MGLFDIFKKKATKKQEQEVTSTPTATPFQTPPEVPTNNDTSENYDILNEKFQGFAPVTGDRNNDICSRFIKKGLEDYSNNIFDENSLSELTFDEFCHIYSTIGWFIEKVAPNLKEKATEYKKFLRKKLLSMLSTFPVYAIHTTVTKLPYVAKDGSLLLYSDKQMAEVTIQNTPIDWLEIREIASEEFKAAFCEYFCTGYKSININGQTKVKIEDVYEIKPLHTYGNICIEACARMIDYKQTQAMIISKARKEERNLTEDELKRLKQQSYSVSGAVINTSLLLPAEIETGTVKNISVPSVSFEDGRKFIGLFTDQGAINRYYNKNVSCVSLPDLVSDQYKQSKDDPSVSGIIINPGREEYLMTKEMLNQLFIIK